MTEQVFSEVRGGEDQLLAAGSKISFRDIYEEEMKLPIHKGRYYKAQDVDDLFVTINGIFMDVSSQAHRNHKVLTETRAQLEEIRENAEYKAELITRLENQNQTLESHLNDLIAKVSEQESQEEASNQKEILKLESKVRYLTNENTDLTQTLRSKNLELKELEESYQRLVVSSHAKMELDESSKNETIKSLEEENERLQEEVLGLEASNNTHQVALKASQEEIHQKLLELESLKEEKELLEKEFDLLVYKYDDLKERSKKRIEDLRRQL